MQQAATPSNSASRPVYRHADLKRVIAPRSIAVVGASRREGSFGYNTLINLASFAGTVYAVNDKYDEVAGRACFASIEALPETPDCVIVAVARNAVETVARQCAQRGVGGVVLFASGYAESGLPERRLEQQRLTAIARETGLRVVGPNCIGLLNHSANLAVSFSLGMDVASPAGPAVGMASQSGAMGNAVAQATHMGVSFSHMLTAGNSCDVDVADYVAYLAEDDACKVIVTLFEGLAHPQRMLEAARVAAERDKPLILCKIANSAAGSGSALSHTGTLAGSGAVYEAAFRRMNAVVVEDLEDLAQTAAFFLKAPRPLKAGRGAVAVIAASGGFCTVAADKAEKYGVDLAPPSEQVRSVLARHIPEFGHVGNPADMTAQNSPQSIRECCEALLAGDEYDTLVWPYTFAADKSIVRITNLDALARQYGKVGCLAWTTAWLGGPGWKEAAAAGNVALFRRMDDCFRTLAAWQRRERKRQEEERSAGEARVSIAARARQAVAAALEPHNEYDGGAEGDSGPGKALSERTSKSLLRHYGIPVVDEMLTRSADEAIAAARALGLPVVLKIEADGLAHKTEAGGVLLDLRDEPEVREGYARLVAAAGRGKLGARFQGVLVQPMIARGVEVIAGARIDPQFGPTVVVGLGGTLVELLRDSVVDLAPLTPSQAMAMLRRLRGHELLTGWRGAPPVDQSALADVLCRLSELAVDQSTRILEIDINPLLCAGSRIVAVDALVVRR